MHPTTVHRDLAFLRRQAQENLEDAYPRKAPRTISKLYDWNKSSVKDMLGDCK